MTVLSLHFEDVLNNRLPGRESDPALINSSKKLTIIKKLIIDSYR